MNDLKKYFKNNDKNLIHKWDHYFDIYERHFKKFQNKKINLLEIGVSKGGSLQMWKNYFGDKANIYGIDIDPLCKNLEEDNIEIFIGSQTDRTFLKEVKKRLPKLDILIDDGGHTMSQQIISYEELFDHLNDNGVYLCEDLHTSYWLKWGGGYKRKGTFIEFSKNWIDSLNAFHSRQKNYLESKFTNSVNSIHYYDSIVILEKKLRKKPNLVSSGKNPIIENYNLNKTFYIKLYLMKKNITNAFLTIINKSLRFFRLSSFIWK